MKTCLSLFISSLCLYSLSCSAHNLKVFANAIGLDINGYVYFSDGTSVPNIPVSIQVDNQVVAALNTDQHGEFHYRAQTIADHRINVNTSAGHLAHYTLNATELSGTRAALPTPTPAKPAVSAPVDCTNANIEHNLHILQTQISSLQQQLASYETKVRWHDVLGGLGYIIGLAGFWLGWLRHRVQTTKGI